MNLRLSKSGVVLFCVGRRNSLAIMNTEQCLSVVNQTFKGEGELFTSRLILPD